MNLFKRFPVHVFLACSSIALAGCGGYGETHEYELNAKVITVLTCDEQLETCTAKVVKGKKEQYSEVWQIAGKPQTGDTVFKLCSFKVVKVSRDTDQVGTAFSSRDTTEKTLDNTNCVGVAQIKKSSFWS